MNNDGEERRKHERFDTAGSAGAAWRRRMHDRVTNLEAVIQGNPDARDLAKGERGGLVDLVSEVRKSSQRNYRLLVALVALYVASTAGEAVVGWKGIAKFVAELIGSGLAK